MVNGETPGTIFNLCGSSFVRVLPQALHVPE